MQYTTKEEAERKLKIWYRMFDEPKTMEVAGDLILEMITKLKECLKK